MMSEQHQYAVLVLCFLYLLVVVCVLVGLF